MTALETSPAKRVSSKGIISPLKISTGESALSRLAKHVPPGSVEEESNRMQRVTPGWIYGDINSLSSLRRIASEVPPAI